MSIRVHTKIYTMNNRRRTYKTGIITGLLLLTTSSYSQQVTTIESFQEEGKPAGNEHFTGTVRMSLNVAPEEHYNANIVTVTFEPGSRTNWHTHKTGQVLFVVEGVGYYQEKGQPVQLIKEGDVVKCPQHVVHWHGASPETKMRHIAIVTDFQNNRTEWLEPVTDIEYNNYQKK